MDSLLKIYSRIANSPKEKIPQLAATVMAPADEYGHLEGLLFEKIEGMIPVDDFTRACAIRKPKKERATDTNEGFFIRLESLPQKARLAYVQSIRTDPGHIGHRRVLYCHTTNSSCRRKRRHRVVVVGKKTCGACEPSLYHGHDAS